MKLYTIRVYLYPFVSLTAASETFDCPAESPKSCCISDCILTYYFLAVDGIFDRHNSLMPVKRGTIHNRVSTSKLSLIDKQIDGSIRNCISSCQPSFPNLCTSSAHELVTDQERSQSPVNSLHWHGPSYRTVCAGIAPFFSGICNDTVSASLGYSVMCPNLDTSPVSTAIRKPYFPPCTHASVVGEAVVLGSVMCASPLRNATYLPQSLDFPAHVFVYEIVDAKWWNRFPSKGVHTERLGHYGFLR